MKYKQIIAEYEKEIIEKGDKGEAFASLQEEKIYLKNLINNRDYYINTRLKKKVGEKAIRKFLASVI